MKYFLWSYYGRNILNISPEKTQKYEFNCTEGFANLKEKPVISFIYWEQTIYYQLRLHWKRHEQRNFYNTAMNMKGK